MAHTDITHSNDLRRAAETATAPLKTTAFISISPRSIIPFKFAVSGTHSIEDRYYFIQIRVIIFYIVWQRQDKVPDPQWQ